MKPRIYQSARSNSPWIFAHGQYNDLNSRNDDKFQILFTFWHLPTPYEQSTCRLRLFIGFTHEICGNQTLLIGFFFSWVAKNGAQSVTPQSRQNLTCLAVWLMQLDYRPCAGNKKYRYDFSFQWSCVHFISGTRSITDICNCRYVHNTA